MSGIAKRYGYQNVQEFYRTYHKSYNTYIAYKEQVAKWEKIYGDDNQKQNKESVLERLKNPPKRTADYQQQKMIKGKDRGRDNPLYESQGIEISLSNSEIDTVFWNAAAPDSVCKVKPVYALYFYVKEQRI